MDKFECLDCHYHGGLNVHGNCPQCLSSAVAVERAPKAERDFSERTKGSKYTK